MIEQKLTEFALKLCAEESNIEKLASYHCNLNCFIWPFNRHSGFYDPLPVRSIYPFGKLNVNKPIMDFIERKIGKKAISQYWNTKYITGLGKMTWFQFQIWWYFKRIN